MKTISFALVQCDTLSFPNSMLHPGSSQFKVNLFAPKFNMTPSLSPIQCHTPFWFENVPLLVVTSIPLFLFKNYKIVGGSCSTYHSAESSLYRLQNGDYMCACTGKTKAKYALNPRSPRVQYDDDDDDDKDYRDCAINYWECPID